MKNFLKLLFDKNWTPWVVYTTHNTGYKDFLVMIRGNTKTGELRFKTIRMSNGYGACLANIDKSAQLKKVQEMIVVLGEREDA